MRAWLVVLVACGSSSTSSPSGTDAAATGGSADPALVFCVSETNRYRAMNSKPALTESAQLETYAQAGAMYDFTNGPHSHFGATSGGGIAFAENECPVQGNWMLPAGGDMSALVGQCIAAFYAEGPGSDYSTHGHYINMMGDYGTLGCGTYQQGTGVTITQDYGQ